MSERRQALRRRTLLSGKIDFYNRAIFDCVVRNLSDGGAKIECAQHIALPDVFHLSIAKREERRRARAVWRGGEELGVEFVEEEDYGNVVAFMPQRHPRQ